MNIKANELRLGNLIRFNNFIGDERNVIVNARFFTSMAGGRPFTEVEGSNNSELNNYYSGIVLTPEILEKCGFVKVEGDCHFLPLNDIGNGFGLYYPGFIQLAHGNSPIMNFINTMYLHQLQNLIFALTGKELEVKL